jgi:murein DD-endopeptidase MepM/ murein hydrolase activator NlpD
MADKDPEWSPYRAFFKNPIKYIDPDGQREWPVDPTFNGHQRRHLNNYGANRPGGRTHRGVDINLGSGSDDLGAPVYSTHNGVISRIARISDGDTNPGGNRVQVTSECGTVATYYMHLDNITADLVVGSTVMEGDQIGTIGGSGRGRSNEYTPHLHYEILVHGQHTNPAASPSTLVDPQALIAPVVLPTFTVTAEPIGQPINPRPATTVPPLNPTPTQIEL